MGVGARRRHFQPQCKADRNQVFGKMAQNAVRIIDNLVFGILRESLEFRFDEVPLRTRYCSDEDGGEVKERRNVWHGRK